MARRARLVTVLAALAVTVAGCGSAAVQQAARPHPAAASPAASPPPPQLAPSARLAPPRRGSWPPRLAGPPPARASRAPARGGPRGAAGTTSTCPPRGTGGGRRS